MTTSLGHRWLTDYATDRPGTMHIRTTQPHWHGPMDDESLNVIMIEATDDSYVLALDLGTLQLFTLLLERFQYAYGWITSWSKTLAYILNSPIPSSDLPSHLRLPSIHPDFPNDLSKILFHHVPVVTDHFDFLRTKSNDSRTRYNQLAEIIQQYPLPRLSSRTPITVLRKITTQYLLPKLRALLSLQPVMPKHAKELDSVLLKKYTIKLHFYFPLPPI